MRVITCVDRGLRPNRAARRQRGDFGMVGKSQMFPAPGSFKGTTDGGGIGERLEIRPFPILSLDNRLALAVAGRPDQS